MLRNRSSNINMYLCISLDQQVAAPVRKAQLVWHRSVVSLIFHTALSPFVRQQPLSLADKQAETRVCPSHAHIEREDVSALRLAAGKRPASLLPTSSFPVYSHFLLPPAMYRRPESQAQSAETACVRAGKLFGAISMYIHFPRPAPRLTRLMFKWSKWQLWRLRCSCLSNISWDSNWNFEFSAISTYCA